MHRVQIQEIKGLALPTKVPPSLSTSAWTLKAPKLRSAKLPKAKSDPFVNTKTPADMPSAKV